MICDKPGIVYADGDDGMLVFGCSTCNFDMVLGEVALLREIRAAEMRHQCGGKHPLSYPVDDDDD